MYVVFSFFFIRSGMKAEELWKRPGFHGMLNSIFFLLKKLTLNTTKEAIWPDFNFFNNKKKRKIQYEFSNFPDDNNINGRGWNCEIWTHSIEARVRDNLFLSLHINDTLHIQKVKNCKREENGKIYMSIC